MLSDHCVFDSASKAFRNDCFNTNVLTPLGFGSELLPDFTVGVAVKLPPHRGASEQIGKLFVSKS